MLFLILTILYGLFFEYEILNISLLVILLVSNEYKLVSNKLILLFCSPVILFIKETVFLKV